MALKDLVAVVVDIPAPSPFRPQYPHGIRELDELDRLLARVKLGPNLAHLGAHVAWRMSDVPTGQMVRISVGLNVPHSTTGEFIDVVIDEDFRLSDLRQAFEAGPAAAEALVYGTAFRLLKSLLAHEAEEGFWVGERHFVEPHRPDRR